MPFAQLEAKLILTMILQRFVPQTEAGYVADLNPTITLRPKNHLRTVLLSAAADASSARWEQALQVSAAGENGAIERQGCRPAFLNLLSAFRL
jgi:hypothetical protein